MQEKMQRLKNPPKCDKIKALIHSHIPPAAMLGIVFPKNSIQDP